MKLSPEEVAAIKDIWHQGDYEIFKFESGKEYELQDKALSLHLARIIHMFIDTTEINQKVRLDFQKYLNCPNCVSKRWQLLVLSCTDGRYQLVDFVGWPNDKEIGVMALLDTKTNAFQILGKIDDEGLEPLVETGDMVDIFINYEEWRVTL